MTSPTDTASAPVTLIGHSPAITDITARIHAVARSMATVFITGESGTGKKLCAQSVHAQSARAEGPFITVNCGAIPPGRVESEVFGHLEGSFTGAIADKTGAAVLADGGTLFLDQICDLDPHLQAKLLHFLETAMVQPLGASQPQRVDTRIICATSRIPADEVRKGNFRADLFYRLHVVPIHMPPLRARGDDVIEIAEAALLRSAREEGRRFATLDDAVKTALRAAPWPGNVRQLLNLIRSIVVVNDADSVSMDMLPGEFQASHVQASQVQAGASRGLHAGELLGKPLAVIERIVIERTIFFCAGSVPRAARMLDVAPSTLYRKMEGWKSRRT